MNDRVSPDELRASHADRDRTADALRVAAGDGQLTAGELDERLEKALTARTVGELAVLTSDLATDSALAVAPSGRAPKDLIRIERQGGNARRDGRWLVPRLIEVRVERGHVVLDFTEAVITQPVLHIDAEVRSGTLTLLTRPGIEIDADDVAVQRDRKDPQVARALCAARVARRDLWHRASQPAAGASAPSALPARQREVAASSVGGGHCSGLGRPRHLPPVTIKSAERTRRAEATLVIRDLAYLLPNARKAQTHYSLSLPRAGLSLRRLASAAGV
jgi:hypothetical protein